MNDKIKTPLIRLKKIDNLNSLKELPNPSYRMVMDLLLNHIKENNLQDENHRIRIIVDRAIAEIFGVTQPSISVHDLYHLVKAFVYNANA